MPHPVYIHEGYVFGSTDCRQLVYSKNYERISIKFFGGLAHGPNRRSSAAILSSSAALLDLAVFTAAATSLHVGGDVHTIKLELWLSCHSGRAAVGMGIPMGMGMVWVWGL